MIPAKKSLGQNFLKSKEALRALVEAGKIEPTDTILEVGPGKGALTAELLKVAGKVIAIEKDHRLIEILREQFKNEIGSGKLEVIEGDVLEYNPSLSDYKIIANIPYYITGSFLQKFLESDNQPSKMVLMLQREVAQRIVAKDGKESILSISVKAYGTPRYVMTVKAKYFSPEPKVDSAIIAIENISKDFFKEVSEEKFFKIMKAGFAHKRKMLIGNLVGVRLLQRLQESDSLHNIFSEIGIPEKARAEDISLSDWKKLSLLLA